MNTVNPKALAATLTMKANTARIWIDVDSWGEDLACAKVIPKNPEDFMSLVDLFGLDTVTEIERDGQPFEEWCREDEHECVYMERPRTLGEDPHQVLLSRHFHHHADPDLSSWVYAEGRSDAAGGSIDLTLHLRQTERHRTGRGEDVLSDKVADLVATLSPSEALSLAQVLTQVAGEVEESSAPALGPVPVPDVLSMGRARREWDPELFRTGGPGPNGPCTEACTHKRAWVGVRS